MNWKRWHWLNDLILPTTLSVMRVCALWLWLALGRRFLLPSYQGPLLSAAQMLVILFFSIFLARWSVKRIRPLNRARILVAVAGLVTILLLLWDHLYQADFALLDSNWLFAWWDDMLFWENELPPAYPLLFALVYLWLRGILDGGGVFSYDNAATAFTGGSISIVLFLILINLDTQPPPPQTSALILLFFTMSLIALSFSSFKRGRARTVLTVDNKLSPDRYWVSSSLMVIALLLVVALLLHLLIAP